MSYTVWPVWVMESESQGARPDTSAGANSNLPRQHTMPRPSRSQPPAPTGNAPAPAVARSTETALARTGSLHSVIRSAQFGLHPSSWIPPSGTTQPPFAYPPVVYANHVNTMIINGGGLSFSNVHVQTISGGAVMSMNGNQGVIQTNSGSATIQCNTGPVTVGPGKIAIVQNGNLTIKDQRQQNTPIPPANTGIPSQGPPSEQQRKRIDAARALVGRTQAHAEAVRSHAERAQRQLEGQAETSDLSRHAVRARVRASKA